MSPIHPPLPLVALAALSLALCACPTTSWSASQHYDIHPVHTRIAFQLSHAGFSRPIGSFSKPAGTLDFDPADWTTAKVSVRVPVATLDLGDASWQRKILDPTFFNSSKFPEARFESTSVRPLSANSAQVLGNLTLHGVTRPVSLKVTLNALKRHPLTLKKTAGFSISGTILRSDFGMGAWKSVIGDEVQLIIEAEATRSHDATHPDDDKTQDSDAPAQ